MAINLRNVLDQVAKNGVYQAIDGDSALITVGKTRVNLEDSDPTKSGYDELQVTQGGEKYSCSWKTCPSALNELNSFIRKKQVRHVEPIQLTNIIFQSKDIPDEIVLRGVLTRYGRLCNEQTTIGNNAIARLNACKEKSCRTKALQNLSTVVSELKTLKEGLSHEGFFRRFSCGKLTTHISRAISHFCKEIREFGGKPCRH